MTRIVLDRIIAGTSIDPILDEVSEGQYTREFLLGHFVQVMCDVACALPQVAPCGIPEAATRSCGVDFGFLPQASSDGTRRTRRHCPRDCRSSSRTHLRRGGLLPEPVPGYAAGPSSMATSSQGPTIASLHCARLVRQPCRGCRWQSTSRSAVWFST